MQEGNRLLALLSFLLLALGKMFQKRRVSSPAPVTTVLPQGLMPKYSTLMKALPHRVACEGGELLHLRQLPHADLVERVAVGGDDFAGSLGKHQVADLRPRVDAVRLLQRVRAPEADGPVGGASARGEDVVLVRGPGQRLHLPLNCVF